MQDGLADQHHFRASPKSSMHPDSELCPAESFNARDLRLTAILSGSDPEHAQSFLALAERSAEAFRAHFPFYSLDQESKRQFEISHTEATEIQEWFETSAAQATMLAVGERLLGILSATESTGHPGHDRRHILIKDPVAALAHIQEDQIDDYRQLFILAALCHDIGRLPEPLLREAGIADRISANHPEMSFEALRQILDDYPEIPRPLRDHLLFATLEHTAGSAPSHFLAQAVQRADREQLIGAEGAIRMIAYNVGLKGYSFLPQIDADRRDRLPHEEVDSLVEHIEFYSRNLFHQIGSAGELRADSRKVVSLCFLMLMTDRGEFEQVFAPELERESEESAPATRHWSKKTYPEELWLRARNSFSGELEEKIDSVLASGIGCEDLIAAMLRLPGSADPRAVSAFPTSGNSALSCEETVCSRLADLEPVQLERVRRALAYLSVVSSEESQADLEVLERAERDSARPLLQAVSSAIACELEKNSELRTDS